MIAVDTNILVYAHREDAAWHEAAYTPVAALCRYHGVDQLWTADRDFGRFPGLVTRNPLVG